MKIGIYGGTFNLFSVTMKKMGVEFTFVSPHCTDEELEAAGIHQNTIRLSIGTEHIDDIIADLENGFSAV